MAQNRVDGRLPDRLRPVTISKSYLSTALGSALIKMGLVPMGAHLFLFYFGLISMLTPPVAIASMVAAEMAGADMWKTGFIGVQLAATAYLLPYLWAFNPALIGRAFLQAAMRNFLNDQSKVNETEI